ncbi:MAG: hypothetical protein ACOCYT_00950 [Chloroflexota bacterium]
MEIHIDTRINLQLQEISRQQEREISALIAEAIAQYVEQHTNETQFRAHVRQTIGAHRWLLDELDKR